MMRRNEAVFVDSGAWIALALTKDPLHEEARAQWTLLNKSAARLFTSVPVIIETFTFLDRNAHRDVALAWRETISKGRLTTVLPCELRDLEQCWTYFKRKDLHKLSATDATSFAIMKRAGLRIAYTFDRHFSIVGFRTVA